jgi:hypothetical protein
MKMDMEKLMEFLQVLEKKLDAYHEKRMVMFDAYEKRMMACLGQMGG